MKSHCSSNKFDAGHNMADIRPYVWVEEYGVVICAQCQFANAAEEVEAHLRSRGHGVRPDEARRIAAAVSTLPGIYRDPCIIKM